MKKKKNDNRMKWIRNIEKLIENDSNSFYTDYEIASECHICGRLDYMDGKIMCSFSSLDKSEDGLYYYNLRLKYAGLKHIDDKIFLKIRRNENLSKDEKEKLKEYEESFYNKNANIRGYHFKEDIIGELLSLFSVFFQCRFYLVYTVDYLTSKELHKILPIKRYNNFSYKQCNPQIHPSIFSCDKNFAIGLENFLNSIKFFDTKYHQQFILACYHYARALKEIGIDHEMLFIRLVSSIEALSSLFIDLDKRDDLLKDQKIINLINGSNLDDLEKEELKEIFENRKSTKKFIRFCEEYSKGFFKGGKYKARQLKIGRNDLPKYLSIIYKARSNYLHKGEQMYLSRPTPCFPTWDMDSTQGMIMDNRKISASKNKLPHTYFFEGLVRHCLMKFLESNSIKI